MGNIHITRTPGWKGSRKARAARDEIVHLRAHRVRALLARHFTLSPRQETDAFVPRVLHSISHLLCAVLAWVVPRVT